MNHSPQLVTVQALIPHTYDAQEVKAGDVYLCRYVHALLLSNAGKVSRLETCNEIHDFLAEEVVADPAPQATAENAGALPEAFTRKPQAKPRKKNPGARPGYNTRDLKAGK